MQAVQEVLNDLDLQDVVTNGNYEFLDFRNWHEKVEEKMPNHHYKPVEVGHKTSAQKDLIEFMN